jgi:TonB-dependent starch-binding outer membrane protein SusC
VRTKILHTDRFRKSHTCWDFFILCVCISLLSTLSAAGQTPDYVTIRGIVTDAETGSPIRNVNVVIVGTSQGDATDENGSYSIARVETGLRSIEFSHIAYITHRITRTIPDTEHIEYNVALTPRSIYFNEVEVLGDTTGRYVRRRGAESHLVTRREIEVSGVRTFSELMRHFVPTAHVREDGPHVYISLMRATSMVRRYHGDNNPLIIIDGMRIGTGTADLNAILVPERIDRIEVLRGPSALAYGTEGRHGVIIVDTVGDIGHSDDFANRIKNIAFIIVGILYFIFIF